MQYKKYRLPGFDTQIARIKQGVTKAEKDLKMFQRRKEKLVDGGLIQYPKICSILKKIKS